MDFRNAVQLVGDYHHVEVSPDAHLDLGPGRFNRKDW